MITSNGKIHIKKYLARQVAYIGRAIAVGVGTADETVNDLALQMEVARAEVILVTYDFTNDRLVFKASLPTNIGAKIYEVGLWSDVTDNRAGDYASRVLSDFDVSESWSTGTYSSTNTRVGADSLRLSPAASTTATSLKSDMTIDLSGNSGADYFSLAYNVSNAFVGSVFLRLKTDSANYYQYTVATNPTAGYKVTSMPKSAASVVGVPTWANIQSVEVGVTSTSGGAGTVDFDVLRVEDIDTYNPNYVLVGRTTLSQPLTKILGQVQEVEFNLDVNVA